ncbi:MAG: FecR domain-containing protein [Pseudomonadota bacterium]
MSLRTTAFRLLALMGVAASALSAANAQLLDSRERTIVANVVETKGDEDFTPAEGPDWRTLVLEQDLTSGDLLRTGTYGGLGLRFEDRTYVRLHANTRMTVADPGAGTGPKRFGLSIGRLWSRASRPDRPVIVETPNATAAIRGTDWFMEVLEDGTSRLVVLDGDVRFFNDLGELSVRAGQSAIARPGLAPEFELEVTPDDRPRWALVPRSDWISFIPLEAAADDKRRAADALVWQALANRQPVAAQAALDALDTRDTTDVRLARALILLMQRAPADAATALEALGEDGSLQQLADAARIGAAVDTARFAKAVEHLDTYERRYGEDITALAFRAYLEAYGGRYDEATAFAERAGERPEADWRLDLLAAQVAVLSGDDNRLASATARLIEAAPDAFESWHWRGIYLATAGASTPDAVQSSFETAARLNPEFVPAIVTIAQLQSATGNQKSALTTLERALAIDPSEPFALAAKAFTYLSMERLDLADQVLAPLEGTPLALHPEIQSAAAIGHIMASAPDRATKATGTVIAASPDRPGIAQLDAIAHWQAGQRGVALDIIENAVRLDPNEPVAARIASAMAQDQFQAGAALRYAQAAWDAKQRNAAAGLVQLPASQSGRIDIGAAFLNLGLGAQAEYYSSLARSQADPNSAFAFASIFPDGLASQSSTSTGLLLDPLAVTFPNRFVQFFRQPLVQQTADLSATVGSDGASGFTATSDSQTLIRTPRQPIALSGFVRYGETEGIQDNSRARSGLLSLRGGTTWNGRHGLVSRLTVDFRDNELPGSFGAPDRDDDERSVNTAIGLGYTFSESWTDRWLLNAAYAESDQRFRNPSAFGSSLDPIEFSLISSLGLPATQDLVARSLFDSPVSSPTEAILFVEPPADFEVTRPIGDGVLPLRDDRDPVSRVETDSTVLSVQARRIFSRNGAEYSFGAEFGRIEADRTAREIIPALIGAGAIGDFADPGAITTFDLFEPVAIRTPSTSSTDSLQAHIHANWPLRAGWRAEASLFPTLLQTRFETDFLGQSVEISDNIRRLDPRLGLAWQGRQTQIRLAAQRTGTIIGVDTIAPLGTLGLLPNQSDGVVASRIDSAILRLEHEARPDLFLHATAEYQDMEDASAALPGERIGQAAFFAEDASLARLSAGTDLTLSDRLGVSAVYTYADGEIDSGPFAGAQLPVIPEHRASIGATWVDPRFFSINGRATFIGERFGDAANSIDLDDALQFALGFAKETRDRRWRFQVQGLATLSDDSPAATGLPATDYELTIGLSRRW